MKRDLFIDWIEFSHGKAWLNNSLAFWIYEKLWKIRRGQK